jgi:hypothetical protein
MDAKRCPRHCCEPFGSYVLFAVQAYAKAALFDAEKRYADFPQLTRIAVQIADCKLTLRSVLYLIESVGTRLDGDAVSIAYQLS